MPQSVKRNLLGLLAAVGLAVISLLIFPFYVTPLGFVWLVALLCIRTGFGALPAFLGAVMLGGLLWSVVGPAVGVFALCIALLSLFAAVVTMRPGVKAEYAVISVFCVIAATLFGAIIFMQTQSGDFVTLIIETIRGFLSYADTLYPGFWGTYFSSMGLEITINDLLYEMELIIRQQFIGQILSYAVLGSALGVMAARKVAARKGEGERFGVPFDVYKWFLPKYTGRTLILSAIFLYFLSPYVQAANLVSAAYAVWMTAYSLFILQGMVHMAFSMKMQGARPGWRYALIGALLMVFRPALFIAGLMDRIAPVRLRSNLADMIKKGRLDDLFKKDRDDDDEEQ
ncbi:MAG: hypothetical protein ACOX8S_01700 [Christensenellales bacterium]